jgi:hypothetical protein
MRVKATKQGVNGFFPKPIEWGVLVSYLDTLKRQEKGEDAY